ncbi:hypothetical protein [Jannaschia sp. M317]|uniref:hypothetical protein n=1 Tax=Jannaschia sp. M317 TaxID=2867011 RepID=UPI0021A615EA|nr:hypothetical protein [Jannaschia sp. M317]UWQ18677.1 hypothetical protein K3551_05150 [Jannaschia sp. M317]
MSKNWIIEVLGDLRGFASVNDMPNLAEQLEEAIVVAIAEIGQVPAPQQADLHGAEVGRYTGPVAGCD